MRDLDSVIIAISIIPKIDTVAAEIEATFSPASGNLGIAVVPKISIDFVVMPP